MWLGEVFARVTLIAGDPGEALHEIRRALLAGRVRSMRERFLSDSIEHVELARSFWRDIIDLFPDCDAQGRETVALRLADGVDESAVWGPKRGCIFYLWQADVAKLWPVDPAANSPLVASPGTEKDKTLGPEPATMLDRIISVLARLDQNLLQPGMKPREIGKLVRPTYKKRWPDTKLTAEEKKILSPRQLKRALALHLERSRKK